MEELAGSGFQNSNPISNCKKRRSITTRRRRRTPSQEPNSPDQLQTQSQSAHFRKREFLLLNTNTNTNSETETTTVRDRDAPSKPTTADTPNKNKNKIKTKTKTKTNTETKVLTKFKVKLSGVSRTIHNHKEKEQNLLTSEPTRKSVRMNKRLRPLSDEQAPSHHHKPVSDSPNTKAKKKRLPQDLPSDGSTDYETGEEEDPAAVAAHVSHMEGPKMRNLTSRQRAMLKGGKDSGRVEFPEGLPPAPSRKSKNKESEEEKQAKKAEAAQRRRLQVEKAAKESQEEAIRKILGLDSDRKKEEKKLKEKEEKERLANLQKSNGSAVKWVMGPTGTVVSFPDDVGLPCIFNSKSCGYPPPREKCAGPACNNAYRYRDSKSKLPLCSLECYRAVQEIA